MVLTKEVLGPIIREAYWHVNTSPPFDADKDWLRVSNYVLEKVQNLALHHYHGHGICKGDTRTHYMYRNHLIAQDLETGVWNAIDSKYQVTASGDEEWCRDSVDKYVNKLKGK